MLRVGRPHGLIVKGLARGGSVERQLDHLPIALVEVDPVVEVVEEPVLEGQPCEPRFCLDVSIGDRRAVTHNRTEVFLVGASWPPRIARVVKEEVAALVKEVASARPVHLHWTSRRVTFERDIRIVQHNIDYRGPVGFAITVALLVLLPEIDDRSVLGDELLLRRRLREVSEFWSVERRLSTAGQPTRRADAGNGEDQHA